MYNLLGRDTLGYGEDEEVYAVLEDDGTEVDEDEYFQLLPQYTRMIVMQSQESWSPIDSMQGYGCSGEKRNNNINN